MFTPELASLGKRFDMQKSDHHWYDRKFRLYPVIIKFQIGLEINLLKYCFLSQEKFQSNVLQ